MANQRMVTAVFTNRADAERAYQMLRNRGYGEKDINVLMSDKTRASYLAEDKGTIPAGNMGTEGMGVGGAVGTVLGATLGAIVAAAAGPLLIPIAGLAAPLVIAGPVAAALAGAGAGGAAGGLVGGLIGLGIPEDNVNAYHQALETGGVVIGVHPRDTENVSDLERDMRACNGNSVVCC